MVVSRLHTSSRPVTSAKVVGIPIFREDFRDSGVLFHSPTMKKEAQRVRGLWGLEAAPFLLGNTALTYLLIDMKGFGSKGSKADSGSRASSAAMWIMLRYTQWEKSGEFVANLKKRFTAVL